MKNHVFNRRSMLQGTLSASLIPLATSIASGPQATAAEPGPYADAILVPGLPPALSDGAFCIAVLPDTQNYSEKFPDTFTAQTKWIADNRTSRNIAFTLHLGDITNRSTQGEWENASKSMSLLDGNVPYALVPGNHDYSEGGNCSDRTTKLNQYFPKGRFLKAGTLGGNYDREPDNMENSFHLFSAGGIDFLVIALEFGPRKDVVRWANEIAAQYPQRSKILITHAYMYSDDTRYDWKSKAEKQSWNPHAYSVAKSTADDVSDGEELWTQLVTKHDNFLLTLNGHVLHDGLARLASPSPQGNQIQQILVNYQMRPHGGDGWLRLLEFRPDKKVVQVYDYSPVLDQHNTSPSNQFTFDY